MTLHARRWTAAALSYLLLLTALAVLLEARPPRLPAAATKAQYAGNTKSYKFHQRSCRYFDCANCTAKFATREEAIAAGYRPCGTCKP